MRAEKISEAAFAPFGTLIRYAADDGRHYLPAVLEATAPAAPALWINRIAAARPPVRIARLERHPFGAQSFVPLGGGRLLVTVCAAAANGAPDPGQMRAFVVPPGTGITYRPGTWHHGLVALDGPLDVLVVMATHGIAGETEDADLEAPMIIEAMDIP
ncbi:ureidoglycolate lyase [Prosthecomicrobium pneumaticum]|uniref:Ureidoglycolate lyase n=1 Tax=Prosthecomicrobium pneumaticum TaxID=81895 RepID=A0A7W9CTV9_9HYPH|nr:ureidoglycolate lyase [Prosthecomicrobium pneumaticum]MBB5751546.1 ureidoglycolate lyase [Prosthecomicrobium pneumaticum]